MKLTGIILDIRGIQNYIFNSNSLKINIGASYIVERVFNELIKETVKKMKLNINFCVYKNTVDLEIQNNTEIEVEIGFIGGGNAIIFFKSKNKAEEFIRIWSSKLLIEAPGLRSSVAINTGSDVKEIIKKLKQQLRENKKYVYPRIMTLQVGFTDECTYTGNAKDYRIDENRIKVNEEEQYLSAEAAKKLEFVEKANNLLHSFKNINDKKTTFPTNFDDLSHSSNGEKNFIAICHIDGNEIGKLFSTCQNLIEIRELSQLLKERAECAFKKLVGEIIDNNLGMIKNKLPIRPIVINGDDITFVSRGKWGIYFSELFLKYYVTEKLGGKYDLSACAGVSIIKYKYPFSRGYQLSEQLCNQAKIYARKEKNTSWINFMMSADGFTGSLDNIIKQKYSFQNKKLLYRPYQLFGGKDRDFGKFIKSAKRLTNLSKNKIHKLKEVLIQDEAAQKEFIQSLKYHGITLPKIYKDGFERKLFLNSKTPYFDMVEIINFYPMELISMEDEK